jgi:hypothetical protein
MNAQPLKPGTRIEFHGTPAMGGFPAVPPEQAKIARPRAENLPLPGPGWHVVTFSDGGKLCAHVSRFRVIDNRAA